MPVRLTNWSIPTMPDPIKLQITSDGTSRGTVVTDVASGRMLQGVVGVDWHCQPRHPATATIKVYVSQLDVEALSTEEIVAGLRDLAIGSQS